MSLALVGLAMGLGARYPRFDVDATQVAGSYGGVAFMMQAALFVVVMILLVGWPSSLYLVQRVRRFPLSASQLLLMCACFAAAGALSVTIWLTSMRSGIRALNHMRD
jgi:hypothetical protein